MNTFNISVNGRLVLKKIPSEHLTENLKLIRGLVWTSGGSDDDIEILDNFDEV